LRQASITLIINAKAREQLERGGKSAHSGRSGAAAPSALPRRDQRQPEGSWHLVLYDITSVYFEGAYKKSELMTFGYNRDGTTGREQIVVGLICNAQGCRVGVEVYAGGQCQR
jgi:hypothetical protein